MLITLLFNNCTFTIGDKIKGNGDITTEQRAVASFNRIDVSGVFTVYLSQGDVESVEVEIDSNLQQYVIVKNKGDKLVVDIKHGINFHKTTKNNVYITLKDINQIDIEGVCTVKTRTALKFDQLKVDASGVSNSTLELYCNRIEVVFSGVGNIELSGKAIDFVIRKSGVGSVKATNLNAENVSIKNSGVGSAEIYASKELTIVNSGVGSITYSGDATIKSINSDGVGKIKKLE